MNYHAFTNDSLTLMYEATRGGNLAGRSAHFEPRPPTEAVLLRLRQQ